MGNGIMMVPQMMQGYRQTSMIQRNDWGNLLEKEKLQKQNKNYIRHIVYYIFYVIPI